MLFTAASFIFFPTVFTTLLVLLSTAVTAATLPTCNSVTQARLNPTLPVYGSNVLTRSNVPFVPVVHGGSSCVLSHGLLLNGVSTQFTATNAYFWTHGMVRSDSIVMCLDTQAVCRMPVVTGVNVTSSTSKRTMLEARAPAPPLSFTTDPSRPEVGLPFTVFIRGTWTGANAPAETEFLLTRGRSCAAPLQSWSQGGGTAVVLNATTLRLSIDAVPSLGSTFVVLQLCARMTFGGVTGAWFSLAQLSGHSNHNVYLGDAAEYAAMTDAALHWEIPGVLGTQWRSLRRYHHFSDPVDLVLDSAWLAARPYTHFTLDATLSVCHPAAPTLFLLSDLLSLNATHDTVTGLIVPEPPTMSGGGRVVLCGSTGANEPWVLLSHDWYSFHTCEFGTMQNSGSCQDCGPTPPALSCNWHGTCGLLDEAFESLQQLCYCDRGYSGDYCETRLSETPLPTETISDIFTASSSTTPLASPSFQLSSSSSVAPYTSSDTLSSGGSVTSTPPEQSLTSALSAEGTVSATPTGESSSLSPTGTPTKKRRNVKCVYREVFYYDFPMMKPSTRLPDGISIILPKAPPPPPPKYVSTYDDECSLEKQIADVFFVVLVYTLYFWTMYRVICCLLRKPFYRYLEEWGWLP